MFGVPDEGGQVQIPNRKKAERGDCESEMTSVTQSKKYIYLYSYNTLHIYVISAFLPADTIHIKPVWGQEWRKR